MNKQQNIDKLVQLGLEEVEAILYVHLVETGPQTPLELSRELNMDRSKIYRYIEKLTSKKLIEETLIDRGIKLKASEPGNIELLVQDREQLLKTQKELLPELLQDLRNLPANLKEDFEIKHYRGHEGLKQMLWNHLSAKEEILAFSYANRNDIVGKPFAEKIREEQLLRKITLYEVENTFDNGNFWYTNLPNPGKYYRSRYISPKLLKITQYIAIFNNTVSLINFGEGIKIGIEIINSVYADTQRQIFWKFWEIAGAIKSKPKKI